MALQNLTGWLNLKYTACRFVNRLGNFRHSNVLDRLQTILMCA